MVALHGFEKVLVYRSMFLTLSRRVVPRIWRRKVRCRTLIFLSIAAVMVQVSVLYRKMVHTKASNHRILFRIEDF